MQQVAIMDYETGSIDIYPYPEDYNGYVEDWLLENNIPFKDSSCYWMHKNTEITVTVHDRLPKISRGIQEA